MLACAEAQEIEEELISVKASVADLVGPKGSGMAKDLGFWAFAHEARDD